MISISQTSVALYLRDYCVLTTLMLTHTDEQPFELFKKHLISEHRLEDATEEYYQRMLHIAYMFTKMKLFSIAEDYTLKNKNNFINNDDLDLSFLDSKITGDRSAISNKKLLQMLRDGFNHSSSNNQLYKISPNCKYIEFSFKRPTPITIKLERTDIANLTAAISDAARTFQFFSFDQPTVRSIKDYISNLKITRHYFPKKISLEKMNAVLQLQDENEHNKAIDIVKSIEHATEREITLTEEQVNRILLNIDDLINQELITPEEFREYLKDFVVILLNKELPIPILKYNHYILDSYFIGLMLPHKVFTYSQMWMIFTKGLEVDDDDNSLAYEYRKNIDKYQELVFKTYYSDESEKMAYASLLFIEYILSNFKPDDKLIRIGNRTVEYQKLRNSIVHGRWHLERDKVVFYDALPNIENELDYNWQAKLDLTALYNYCSNILKNKLKEDKPKQKQKTILEK